MNAPRQARAWMKRPAFIVIAVTTAAALVGGLVWLLMPRSQEAIAEDCAVAITTWDGPFHVDKERPPECEGLNDDDYGLILLHRSLTDEGVFTEDGDVDLGKLLDE